MGQQWCRLKKIGKPKNGPIAFLTDGDTYCYTLDLLLQSVPSTIYCMPFSEAAF